MRSSLREIGVTLILVVIIFFGLRATIQSSLVVGPSMLPNFKDGQRLLVNKVVYALQEPERGDAITFHSPNISRTDYIKRIIGLPGEYIEIIEGKVYINKENGEVLPLDEPHIKEQTNKTFRGEKIPANEYFVLGDNRANSDDSRTGWTLPRQNIIGKAWISLWPPEKWGLIPDYSY